MTTVWSEIGFTTLAGTAQGLVVVLVLARWAGVVVSVPFSSAALALALTLLFAALGMRFLQRDSRLRELSADMNRCTRWSKREAVLLPAFIATVVLWWLMLQAGLRPRAELLPVLLLALALWGCTTRRRAGQCNVAASARALMHAGIVLAGLAAGAVLSCALAALSGEERLLAAAGPWAVGLVTLASVVHGVSLVRRPRLSMPWPLVLMAFVTGHVLPLGLMAYAIVHLAVWPWMSALMLFVPGLLAEHGLIVAAGARVHNEPPSVAP